MTKYRVYFERTGHIDVEAENELEAEKKAILLPIDAVMDEDGWSMQDATETVEQAESW